MASACEKCNYFPVRRCKCEEEQFKEQIKGLEHKNILLRIDLAEALEYCIGDDIESATESLEEALKRL